MSDIDDLRATLSRALALRHDSPLRRPPGDHGVRLDQARRALRPPRGHRSEQRVARAVLAFRLALENTPFVDLKYACHGLARPVDWESRRLFDDPSLVERLLRAVATLPRDGHRFRACHRALRAAWAREICPVSAVDRSRAWQMNSERLQQFLQREKPL